MATTGFEEILNLRRGLILVEWADKIADYFCDWDWILIFNHCEAEGERSLEFIPRDSTLVSILETLNDPTEDL